MENCLSSPSRCVYNPPVVETLCDPDGAGELTATDGLCGGDMNCGRLSCRPCQADSQCSSGHCECADDTCSTRRCFDSALLCQYVAGDSSTCAAQNTSANRQGQGCSSADDPSLLDGFVCDGNGACVYLVCASCGYLGCEYAVKNSDCGNSTMCGQCQALGQCIFADPAAPCSDGTGGCNDLCDGDGLCVAAEGRACGAAPCDATCSNHTCSTKNFSGCGGEGVCAGSCYEGICGFPTVACGTSNCVGSCSNGSCNTSGLDCGTCCACSALGDPTYAVQNADCGDSRTNPCGGTCSGLGTCNYPPITTRCGYGVCHGTCSSGACNTTGTRCCSATTCDKGSECSGTCQQDGICTSAGEACGDVLGCTRSGTCGASGVCHTPTTLDVCNSCFDDGHGYSNDNVCVTYSTTCCKTDLKEVFMCCPTSCDSKSCISF